jgi:hypothetical protein
MIRSSASAPLAPEEYAFSVVENTERAPLLVLNLQFQVTAIRCKRYSSGQPCEIGMGNRLVVNSAGQLSRRDLCHYLLRES